VIRPLVADVPVGSFVLLDGRSEAAVHLPPGSDAPWRIDVVDVAPGVAYLDVGDDSLLLDESMALEIDADLAGPLRFTNGMAGVLALLFTTDRVPAVPRPGSTTERTGVGATATRSVPPAVKTGVRRLARRLRSVARR
jgi:hypothetical protein